MSAILDDIIINAILVIIIKNDACLAMGLEPKSFSSRDFPRGSLATLA